MTIWILSCWLAASIEGRLWNPISGSPVRKADVVVGTLGGEPVKRAISDVNGHYLVEGLPAGRYRVAAGRAGFVAALSPAVVVLKADESRTNVNIAMQPPAVISGHVFDSEGEPVEKVPVIALSRNDTTGVLTLSGAVNTNDNGEFRFGSLRAGTYAIRSSSSPAPLGEVYVPTYYPGAVAWEGASPVRVGLGGEARDIDIRVGKSKAGSVAGVAKGAGAVRVTLSLKSTDAVMMAVPEASATAAPDGRFVFTRLASGTYVVRAEAEKLWGTREVAVNGDEAHAEFEMQPAGVVRAESDAPVHAILTRGDRYRSEARRGEGGGLLFDTIVPGTWNVDVDAVAPDSFVESVKWGEQEVLGHPFEIGNPPWPQLRVRIGKPAGTLEGEGGSVSLVPEGGGKTMDAVAGNDGRYAIRGIRPGKYRLTCSGESIEIGSGQVLKRDCKL